MAAPAQENRQAMFQAAAKEFGVPVEILLAVSYHESRWENHDGRPSASGGYGLMHLTSGDVSASGIGEDAPEKTKKRGDTQIKHTLDDAAKLLNVPKEELQYNDKQNVRGGAALLASYGKATHDGKLPSNDSEWYGAVAQMSESGDIEQATAFANNVFATVQKGVSRKTSDNQTIAITGDKSVKPNKSAVDELERRGRFHRHHKHDGDGAECPRGLDCRFVPARYAQNNPNDPVDYGNYDQARRPKDMKINQIVIHDTEGSYDSSIAWFQDPASYTSAHYVIRSSDGQVTQMVKTKDVAWHAGNWYTNMHSIGVEHEGFAAQGATWYTEEMYHASAKLVRYLAHKYDIPLDRQHIVGHDQFHGPTPATVPGMHSDPGPYWDWDHYMDLLHASVRQEGGWHSDVVTIAPKFAKNQPEVTDCTTTPCQPLPTQSANFVYMRTAPHDTAPLVGDVGLHPDNSAGTTAINDTSARATFGEQFVVAERQGDWTAVWYGGQKAWFKNPQSWQQRTALTGKGRVITPKEGKTSIPLYGRAYPEANAFPSSIPVQAITPLPYTIPAGQKYVSYGRTPTDFLYASTFDSSVPDDHTVVMGHEKYYQVSYNQRQGYVKASDVDVSYMH